jgi:hypothetical protein
MRRYPVHDAVWPTAGTARSLGAMANQAEWARRVAQWRRSGLTAAQFCEGRDYAPSTLRWNSSRLGRPDSEAPKAAMIQVRREPPRVAPHVVIEIEDALVHVPAGVDSKTLATVFEALRAGGTR